MNNDDAQEAYDKLDRLNREVALQRKLDTENKLKRDAESTTTRPLQPAPSVWGSVSAEYKISRLECGQRKMFKLIGEGIKPLPDFTPEFCEAAWAEERRLLAEADRRRSAAEKEGQAQAEAVRLAENRKTFDRIFPFLRVCPVDFADRYEITKTGVLQATKKGICDCGFVYKNDLVPNIDKLLSNEAKSLWWRRGHEHTYKNADGSIRAGGQRIEPSIGVWLDFEALAYATANPDAPIRFSSGPSEAVKVERPF